MNLSVIIQNIPVAATALLVVVGSFIAFEIYRMISSKMPKVEKKKKPVESPETMQPLVFPKVTGARIKNASGTGKKIAPRTLMIVGGVAITLMAIAGGAYGLYASGFTISSITSIFTRSLPTPDQIDPLQDEVHEKNYNAAVLLYRETPENQWLPLSPEELSTLQSGDIIRIEVTTDEPADRINVLVNEEVIPLSPNQSPAGNVYARYIIPTSASQYTVAVQIY